MTAHEPFPPEFNPRNIRDLLLDRAAAAPQQPGFIARFHDDEYQTVTYAEWDARSRRLALALRRRFGLSKGSKVAWVLGNEHGGEALLLYHAVHKLGAVNVPLNTRLATPEYRYVLEHCGASVCVYAGAFAARVEPALGSARPVQVDAMWDELLAEPDGELPPLELDPEDDADLVYTSGTTGRPKGVVHTHGSSLASGIGWGDAFRLRAEDVLQSPFPVFTGGGLHFNGLAILWGGGTFVLDDFDTDRSLRLMASGGATVYVAVPTLFQFMLESPILPSLDLSHLRILDYGGASMAPSLILRLRQAFPSARLMQTYGLTEGGPGGLYLAEEYALTRLGAVGNRGAGRFTRFRVVDDSGNDVGPDGTGEFVLRGPAVMKEYYRDPEATAAAFAGGWLHTGDIVRMDRDGFVYHIDRKKDIVVRGGYNVSSVEVEGVLMAHPAVAEAAVVAKPHPKLGEDLRAYVVLRAGHAMTAAELTAYCRENLADFKAPRDIVFRAELPHNASGKVLKRRLREEAQAEGERGGAQ